jgi:hypothetical protein
LEYQYIASLNALALISSHDSVAPGGGVPNLIGTGTVLVNGAVTGETRFGDLSSVAIDPTNVNGCCAVAAQQYFEPGGNWTTRIARVGTC